jgi:Flp pilus assembly protein TadG
MARILKLHDPIGAAGSVAIEYGLILPAMLLFTFGIMDAGRLIWTNMTLSSVTEAAARCGAVNTTTCATASIPAYAATLAKNLGIYNAAASNFVATTPTCGVQVKATYTFQFLVPWFPQFSASAPFGSTTKTLNATACYPK